MIRGIFYAGLIGVFAIGVYLKIGVIQEKRSAPTVSIGKEHAAHGKPVEVYKVQRSDMRFYERLTGKFRDGNIELLVSKIQWDKIRQGQNAKILRLENVMLPDDTDSEAAKVSFVAKSPGTNTGLYRVVVQPAQSSSLIPGQTVVVDVNTRTLSNVISVPAASIEREGEDSFLWILNDQRQAERVQVVEGEESQRKVQVTRGLSLGDMVIVRGASTLQKGDVARIVSGGESND